MDKKENFECISAEQAYKLAQNANITDNMFHAVEIADYCKNKLASKKTLDDIEKNSVAYCLLCGTSGRCTQGTSET